MQIYSVQLQKCEVRYPINHMFDNSSHHLRPAANFPCKVQKSLCTLYSIGCTVACTDRNVVCGQWSVATRAKGQCFYMQEAKSQPPGHIHSEVYKMIQELYYIKVLDLAKEEYVYIFHFLLPLLRGPQVSNQISRETRLGGQRALS